MSYKHVKGLLTNGKKVTYEQVEAKLLVCDRCKGDYLLAIKSPPEFIGLVCKACHQGLYLQLSSGEVVKRFVIK
jgi:hypothetical protein